MCYNKRDLYNFTRRLYALIRNHSDWIYLQKLRGNVASYECSDDDVTIKIDYRKEFIPGLIHEALHHWNHSWSETMVLRHESMIINSLSQKQIKNLIKVLAEVL